MKSKFYIAVILIFLFFSICEKTIAQAPDWMWAKGFNGTSTSYGMSIVTDAQNNVYTGGWLYGTADFDPGPGIFNLTSAGDHDFYISKLDSSGNFVWAKAMGGPLLDLCNGIATDDSGNVYMTGSFSATVDFDPGPGVFNMTFGTGIYFLKLDSSGNFMWAEQLEGTGFGSGFCIDIDDSGYICSSGYFQETVDFDPDAGGTYNLTSVTAGAEDAFVLKLDRNGDFIWAGAMGGPSDESGNAIAHDASGNLYITGVFSYTADFDPSSTATFNLTSAGGEDVYIVKLDASGIFQWAKSIGGPGYEGGNSIATDASGDIYSTGFFELTVDLDPSSTGTLNVTSAGLGDLFILKLSGAGNFVWARTIGGALYESGESITTDPAGNIYTTGQYQGTVDFDPGSGVFNLISTGSGDAFISKLDNSGNFVWAKSAGGSDVDQGHDIAVDASGNICVSGFFFSGMINFDNDTLINSGISGEGFVAKMGNSITGIESVNPAHGISIYPNPANSEIIVNLSAKDKYEIEIFSASGKIIIKEQNQNRIDISKLASGVYFMKVMHGNNFFTEKFIKL